MAGILLFTVAGMLTPKRIAILKLTFEVSQ